MDLIVGLFVVFNLIIKIHCYDDPIRQIHSELKQDLDAIAETQKKIIDNKLDDIESGINQQIINEDIKNTCSLEASFSIFKLRKINNDLNLLCVEHGINALELTASFMKKSYDWHVYKSDLYGPAMDIRTLHMPNLEMLSSRVNYAKTAKKRILVCLWKQINNIYSNIQKIPTNYADCVNYPEDTFPTFKELTSV